MTEKQPFAGEYRTHINGKLLEYNKFNQICTLVSQIEVPGLLLMFEIFSRPWSRVAQHKI